LVAKSRKSHYEPGQRSGAWQKMRVNQSQELVISGCTPSLKNFDALVIGYYDNDQLMYAARTRNGFTPASRIQLFKKLKPLQSKECPFANLPEKKAGRWGAGLTRRKCRNASGSLPRLWGSLSSSNGRMTAIFGIAVLLRSERTRRQGMCAGNSTVALPEARFEIDC
jgi:bifunctional non-homologous end joining protein LigD